jgi:hypothetical protein
VVRVRPSSAVRVKGFQGSRQPPPAPLNVAVCAGEGWWTRVALPPLGATAASELDTKSSRCASDNQWWPSQVSPLRAANGKKYNGPHMLSHRLPYERIVRSLSLYPPRVCVLFPNSDHTRTRREVAPRRFGFLTGR